MWFIFEEVCIQFLIRKNRNMELPFVFDTIGKWWGNNPIKKCQEEIDILAVGKDNALFGECKWKNEAIGLDVINGLIEKAGILNFSNKYYAFFSKSGFSQGAIEFAKENKNIILFDSKDLDDVV